MNWLKRNWYVLVFVIGNLALAATPTQAGLKDDLCIDGQGNEIGCCSNCMFFCGCQFDE